MRAKAPMGRVKAGLTLTVPQKTHTHTHTKSNAETQFLSLNFRQVIPLSGSKVLMALLLFLLFVNSIQLLTAPNLSSVVE